MSLYRVYNDMNTLELAAEAKARLYIKGLTDDPEQLARAKEDYATGYLAGAARNAEVLDFILQQLAAIVDTASNNDEFYSLSIAKYTIERLR